VTWLVDVEPPPVTLARRGMRLGAYVIDQAIAIVGIVLSWLFRASGLGVAGAAIVLIWFGTLSVVQIILLSTRGQSLGKLILRIAIVDNVDKTPPGFVRAALIRQLPIMAVSVFLPQWGLVYQFIDALPIFGSGRRCIHDRIAGTIVVNVVPEELPI